MNGKMTIGTHSGTFHADDVMAVAILALTAPGKQVEIKRSRDPQVLAKCAVLVDVGGCYSPPSDGGQVVLDHHHRGGAGMRESGIAYASAGLTWKHFGRKALTAYLRGTPYNLNDSQVDIIWEAVDAEMIAPIDAGDTGYDLATEWATEIRPLTFAAVLSALNPNWHEAGEPEARDGLFETAVEMIKAALSNFIEKCIGTALAEQPVRTAAASRMHPAIMILDKFMPWEAALPDTPAAADILYVVFPDTTESPTTWRTQCVPKEKGSFSKRKPLPTRWGGLRGKDLEAACGVPDVIFCHPGLYICGTQTKDGAIRMAQLATNSVEEPVPAATTAP